MALPIVPLASDSIYIGGVQVEYHSLSRADALKLHAFTGREDEAEVHILVAGTGCTPEEAEAFRSGNDTETAGLLIDAILVLSGLASDNPKT